MFRGLMLYVFVLQSEFVFKQKFKFWNPLNVFVSLIGLLLNKSCKKFRVFVFKRLRTVNRKCCEYYSILNVYGTTSISQIRIAEMSPSHFPFLPCRKAASRHHTMDYQAPKIRKENVPSSDTEPTLKTRFLIRN